MFFIQEAITKMETKEEKAKTYLKLLRDNLNVMPMPSGNALHTYLLAIHTLSSLAFGVYMAADFANVINKIEQRN